MLARVLAWKFPKQQGISTVDNILVDWPGALGKRPTDVQLAQWTVQYQGYVDMESYKAKRLAQKIDEMAPLGNVTLLQQDLIDALIESIYGDRSDLDILKAELDRINASNPK